MNIADVDKNKCTGCGACGAICPKKCIEFISDEEGFLIPKVNFSSCINCGICLKRCQTIHKPSTNKPLTVFAAQTKNFSELKNSASGGLGYLLSKFSIDKGGVAYGSGFSQNLKVKHWRATCLEELLPFNKSKYVQSDFLDVYKTIKSDCEKRIPITVVGTPCQIAGLKLFLNKDYPNLLLVDLVCHGVPSPMLFDEYIKYEQRRKKIISYNFRNKEKNTWLDAANVAIEYFDKRLQTTINNTTRKKGKYFLIQKIKYI